MDFSQRLKRHKLIFVFAVLAIVYALACFWLSGIASENRYMVRAFDSDESGILMVLQKMHADRFWEPMLYNYGTGHTYVALCLLYLLGLIKQVTFQDIAHVARFVNVGALIGIGWLLVNRGLCRKQLKWAFLCLVFLLFCGINFRYAINAKPEHLQTFFIVFSIFLMQKFFVDQRFRWLWWAGFCAGLAFATKYMGAFVLAFEAAVLLVFFLMQKSEARKPLRLIKWFATLASGALMGVMILGVYLLIRFPEVLKTLDFISYITGRGFLSLDNKHWYDWFPVLFDPGVFWWGLGLLTLPGAMLVFNRALKREGFELAPYLGVFWCATYFVYLLVCAKVYAPRYLLILLPLLLDFAFHSLGEFEQWLQANSRQALARLLFPMTLCVVIYVGWTGGWSHAKSLMDRAKAPRIEAGEWLSDNVRHTSLVAYDLYTYVPPEFMRRYHQNYLRAYNVMTERPDYIVANIEIMKRYLDPERAVHYPEGPDSFMSHYMLYARLNTDDFPGYRMIKDFGEVRIYEKTSIR